MGRTPKPLCTVTSTAFRPWLATSDLTGGSGVAQDMDYQVDGGRFQVNASMNNSHVKTNKHPEILLSGGVRGVLYVAASPSKEAQMLPAMSTCQKPT
jgi:hypothetical protein